MPTKDEVASDIARKHYQVEAGLRQIFRINGNADVELSLAEPIRLLEVNDATIPSRVMPLQFGPAPASGIPYPSIIVEVTPEEFEKIKTSELALPQGWVIGEELLRPAGVNGAA